MNAKEAWPDKEAWKAHGHQQGFNQRNPYSLNKSESVEERSWYSRGNAQKWLKDFEFKRKRIDVPAKTYDEWVQYGLTQRYNETSPVTLIKSDNSEDRRWYDRGSRKGWLQDFPFQRTVQESGLSFENSEEWKKYGIDRGYKERTPSSLVHSEKLEERSWYNQGKRKGWLSEFELQRRAIKFDTLSSWKQYGLQQGFNGRNAKSIAKSKETEERSWYSKGAQERWLTRFSIHRSEGAPEGSLLEQYVGGSNV